VVGICVSQRRTDRKENVGKPPDLGALAYREAPNRAGTGQAGADGSPKYVSQWEERYNSSFF
jgi:hypothetical protein